MFNTITEMPHGKIYNRFCKLGYRVSSEQFDKLNFREVRKALRLAEKAARLEDRAWAILQKQENKTDKPAVASAPVAKV